MKSNMDGFSLKYIPSQIGYRMIRAIQNAIQEFVQTLAKSNDFCMIIDKYERLRPFIITDKAIFKIVLEKLYKIV